MWLQDRDPSTSLVVVANSRGRFELLIRERLADGP